MPQRFDIIIIGSGFAGLGMAIQLKRAGRHDFVILEEAADLGGTWRDNTYPGCACDIPSHLYSFSFAPNPRWTRMFSPQPEILDYLRDCARRFGLETHLRFDSPVTSAVYDEAAREWSIEVEGSEPLTSRVLVAGVGALHRPKTPDLPGVESFGGTTFHSADWPADVDLSGRRVAVVGTGASAVQIVPAIAEQVEQLDVYQRTPAWVMPRPDRAFAPAEQQRFERHPIAQRVARDIMYWLLEVRGVGLTVSPRLLPVMERMARRYLERKVPDPELRARLTPNYRFGCKRALLSSSFYPALQRPDVELVTEPIACLTADGIRDVTGVERPVDTVIFATGFDLRANLQRIRIVGVGGESLEQSWAEQGVNAHHGIMVSGFPNLFLLLGPNTGLGHNSVVFMIESQVAFVLRALRLLDESGERQIDVHDDTQRRSVQAVQQELRGTVWQSGCDSWYLDENGRNFAIWPKSTMRYWLALRRIKRSEYELSGGSLRASAPSAADQDERVEEMT